ncbi:hypothetical protein DFH27DRAFT_556922 [Peziza echinospora]|nr:hypothetical protein DFH27DRAFT_556922 [Peziza echinospora]
MALPLRRLVVSPRRLQRLYTTSSTHPTISDNDCLEALSKPSWSVKTLLPPSSSSSTSSAQIPEENEITPGKLRHLLRLAALPPPSSPEEEAGLLKTLLDQLHFVKDVQSVDTTGIAPLQMIRDEVDAREYTIEDVEPEALGIQVEDDSVQGKEQWNVLGATKRKVGSYFVVDEAPELNVEKGAKEGLKDEARKKVERDLEGI